MYLRFTASLLALAAGAAGVVVVALLLRSVPGPTSTATSTTASRAAPVAPAPSSDAGGRVATPNEPGFPSPPPGALVLAREAGSRALALAVGREVVRVSVLSPTGGGARALDVTLRFGDGPVRRAQPCGAGCYQLEARAPRSPVTVGLDGTPYRFELPALPAPEATATVKRATATWNDLSSLVWHERLASSPTNAIHTVYRAVAPDELAYTIAGRSAAVIVGGTRWDRAAPGAPWVRSPQDPPIRQPQPFWERATDAHVLGSVRVGGRDAWRVSFFDPSTPAWFEMSVDKRTHRTLELDMTAAAHFMHHEYGPFDAPIRIVPPA